MYSYRIRRTLRRRRRPLMRRRLTVRRPLSLRRRRLVTGGRRLKNIHYFKRTYTGTPLTATSTASTPGCFFATIQDLPNYNEFTGLYDQYRITGVKFLMVPQFTQHDLNPLTTAIATTGPVLTILDRTLANPATENAFLEYQSLRKHSPWKPIVRYWRPNTLDDTSGNPSKITYGDWIAKWDTLNPHYGLNIWFPALVGPGVSESTEITYNTYITLYFQCKSVK